MREIECRICHKVPDCPQLKDEVWALIGKPDELLCLKHATELLGRPIEPDDLADCPANAYAKELAERKCDCDLTQLPEGIYPDS